MSSFNHQTSASNLPDAPRAHEPTTSYLTYPVAHVVSGLYRRLTDPSASTSSSRSQSRTSQSSHTNNNTGVYTPPHRTASPFQPPPLSPLILRGIQSTTSTSAQILSRSLAEEIRLLVPPRLQLVEDWTLAYSVEQDGVSLGTLYAKCDEYRGKRAGFVLVVRDGAGGNFGAFLTDPPHPAPHYYGTGECFLWRASLLPSTTSLLASLPPPPSADTTHLQRSTTIASPNSRSSHTRKPPHLTTTNNDHLLTPQQQQPDSLNSSSLRPGGSGHTSSSSPHRSGTSTPERIRFKAFPYSGVNDYMIFCEHDYLSVGGGDGRYGLWLDGVLERGISSPSLTFGNEGLSEEGEKFEVVGVEVWYIGI